MGFSLNPNIMGIQPAIIIVWEVHLSCRGLQFGILDSDSGLCSDSDIECLGTPVTLSPKPWGFRGFRCPPLASRDWDSAFRDSAVEHLAFGIWKVASKEASP